VISPTKGLRIMGLFVIAAGVLFYFLREALLRGRPLAAR
jgi:uncharacterized protein YjeT (DUF2065 family)